MSRQSVKRAFRARVLADQASLLRAEEEAKYQAEAASARLAFEKASQFSPAMQAAHRTMFAASVRDWHRG
jgi:hypothetical protein